MDPKLRAEKLQKLIDNDVALPTQFRIEMVRWGAVSEEDLVKFVDSIAPFSAGPATAFQPFAPKLSCIDVKDLDKATWMVQILVNEKLTPLIHGGSGSAEKVKGLRRVQENG